MAWVEGKDGGYIKFRMLSGGCGPFLQHTRGSFCRQSGRNESQGNSSKVNKKFSCCLSRREEWSLGGPGQLASETLGNSCKSQILKALSDFHHFLKYLQNQENSHGKHWSYVLES